MGEDRKKEEKGMKGERRKKMNKIEISCLVFSNLLKVSGTFRVDIALEH